LEEEPPGGGGGGGGGGGRRRRRRFFFPFFWGSGKCPPCFGLPEKQCVPNPWGGLAPELEKNIKKMCCALYCHSMCTKLTWKVKVEATGPGPTGAFKSEVENEKVQKALKAQFIVYGCSEEKFDCCVSKDMWDYVENNVYQDQFPVPLIPIRACLHDPENEEEGAQFCSKCKSAVKVTLESLECPEELRQPDSESGFLEVAQSYASLSRRAHTPSSFRDMAALETAAALHKPPALGVNARGDLQFEFSSPLRPGRDSARQAQGIMQARFEQVAGGVASAPGGKYDVGPPAHKSFYERCSKLAAKIKAKLSALESEFQKRVCGCLGCCKELCYYPTTINSIDQLPSLASKVLGSLIGKVLGIK
jgi:hypothetical protein